MERQLIVTSVAALGTNDITRYSYRRTIGYEVEGIACVAGTQVELREITGPYHADCRGSSGVKSSRGLRLQRVLILPGTERYQCPATGFESRARDCTQARRQ